MKRCSRWKALNAARKKEHRRLTRIIKLRERVQSAGTLRVPFQEKRIYAPAQFALENDNHDAVVLFLRDLREAFLDGSKIVCIDFRATVHMVAGGTLLFFSELHRLKEMFPLVGVRCIASKNDTVNQVLQHLRIYEALGFASSVVPTRHDVINWRTASSAAIDGEMVGSLLEKYEDLGGPIAGQLFRGAGEAMFNVRHAYLDSRRDGLPESGQKKWWMFCRESEDNIVVAVCDLGIGIPRSLPIKYPLEAISALIASFRGASSNNDAKMIHAAMEIRRTSTNLRGRGKGLTDFLRIIDEVPFAKLFIFSNRGLVSYQSRQIKRVTFSGSIKGTVVVWVVPLPKEGR